MKNDLDKLILGFVIGGLLGGSIFYLMRANPKERQLFFKKIGKIVEEVGDFLKKSSLEEKMAAFEKIKKSPFMRQCGIADLLMLAAIEMIPKYIERR